MSADPLALLLRSFRVPTVASRYPEALAAVQAQGWDFRRLLLDLCEAEAADRLERRRERLLNQSRLPQGKTLGTLDETQLPAKVRRQWPALLEGGFVERAENLLAFGLPGRRDPLPGGHRHAPWAAFDSGRLCPVNAVAGAAPLSALDWTVPLSAFGSVGSPARPAVKRSGRRRSPGTTSKQLPRLRRRVCGCTKAHGGKSPGALRDGQPSRIVEPKVFNIERDGGPCLAHQFQMPGGRRPL